MKSINHNTMKRHLLALAISVSTSALFSLPAQAADMNGVVHDGMHDGTYEEMHENMHEGMHE